MLKKSARKPPPPGPGRPKGSVNKTTALLKDAILKAAEAAGNRLPGKAPDIDGLTAYLEDQAIANPGPFMQLLGKVLPMQVTGPDNPETGEPGVIEIRVVDPRAAG